MNTDLEHNASNGITTEDCLLIYSAIIDSISKCNLKEKIDFWNNFIEKASRYAYRIQFKTMSSEESDSDCTRVYNDFIVAINELAKISEKGSWKEKLGEGMKRIGDFACFVSYITSTSTGRYVELYLKHVH